MKKRLVSLLLVAAMCGSLAACSSSDSGSDAGSDSQGTETEEGSEEGASGDGVTVSIAMLNNPICSKLADLTEEYYEAEGVTIDFAILPENDLREKANLEASTGGTTYDVYFTGPYEANYWINYGWAENLQPYIDKMTDEQKASLDLMITSQVSWIPYLIRRQEICMRFRFLARQASSCTIRNFWRMPMLRCRIIRHGTISMRSQWQ